MITGIWRRARQERLTDLDLLATVALGGNSQSLHAGLLGSQCLEREIACHGQRDPVWLRRTRRLELRPLEQRRVERRRRLVEPSLQVGRALLRLGVLGVRQARAGHLPLLEVRYSRLPGSVETKCLLTRLESDDLRRRSAVGQDPTRRELGDPAHLLVAWRLPR